ncbi:MAG: hypothetical protein IJ223_05600 [Clostridia bacterium]|nr:hypothetical protein [Clostridia bacterium]
MKKKLLYGIVAIIVLAGIIMFAIQGFNIGNKYGSYTKLHFYVEDGTVNKDEISQIVSESFNGKEAIIQNVEYFGEMVLITLPSVADEEVDTFLGKINEKYSLDYTKDDLEIINMPSLTLKEVVSPYIFPVCLTVLLALIYMVVRYRNLGFWKVLLKTILAIVVIQALIFSIYLIFNLPLDLSIIPVALTGLGIAIIYEAYTNNKNWEQKKKEEEEE